MHLIILPDFSIPEYPPFLAVNLADGVAKLVPSLRLVSGHMSKCRCWNIPAVVAGPRADTSWEVIWSSWQNGKWTETKAGALKVIVTRASWGHWCLNCVSCFSVANLTLVECHMVVCSRLEKKDFSICWFHDFSTCTPSLHRFFGILVSWFISQSLYRCW